MLPHSKNDFDFIFNEAESDFNIMQFTGVEDRIGTDVYEGDLFKDEKNGNVGVVKFGEYFHVFDKEGFTDKGSHVGFYVDARHICREDLAYWSRNHKIIGNIYQNPEIVKENYLNI